MNRKLFETYIKTTLLLAHPWNGVSNSNSVMREVPTLLDVRDSTTGFLDPKSKAPEMDRLFSKHKKHIVETNFIRYKEIRFTFC